MNLQNEERRGVVSAPPSEKSSRLASTDPAGDCSADARQPEPADAARCPHLHSVRPVRALFDEIPRFAPPGHTVTLPRHLVATLAVLAMNETEGPVTLEYLVERAEMPQEFVAGQVAELRALEWIVPAHPEGERTTDTPRGVGRGPVGGQGRRTR